MFALEFARPSPLRPTSFGVLLGTVARFVDVVVAKSSFNWRSPMLAMFGASPVELVIVGIVALLLFGKRLPDVMRSLGKSITEFKKGVSDSSEEKLP